MTSSRTPCRSAIGALLFSVLFAGCGAGGPTLFDVSGTVTYKGQPVQDLQVFFVPEVGRPSTAITDAQGHFALKYTSDQKGALAGKHRVYVEYVPPTMDEQIAIQEGKGRYPDGVKEVLAKYGDREKTPLTFDIKKSQQLDLRFD